MAKYRDTYQCYGLAIKADKMSPQKDYYLLLFKVNVLSNAYRVLTQTRLLVVMCLSKHHDSLSIAPGQTMHVVALMGKSTFCLCFVII